MVPQQINDVDRLRRLTKEIADIRSRCMRDYPHVFEFDCDLQDVIGMLSILKTKLEVYEMLRH